MPVKSAPAFTLIEMAVVLVILALIVGGLLTPLTERTNQQRVAATRKTLNDVKEALTGFAIINARLPCPAVDTAGTENSAKCDEEGYVPWKELGVGRYDAWGRPLRYRVDKDYTTRITTQNNTLRIRTIRLTSDTGDDRTWLTSKTTDTRVLAVIFSCGNNGLPDPTPPNPPSMDIKYSDDGYYYTNDKDGTRNVNTTCENAATSWKQSDVYIYDSSLKGIYDDEVTWLSKNTLMYRLIAAGKWPL